MSIDRLPTQDVYIRVHYSAPMHTYKNTHTNKDLHTGKPKKKY